MVYRISVNSLTVFECNKDDCALFPHREFCPYSSKLMEQIMDVVDVFSSINESQNKSFSWFMFIMLYFTTKVFVCVLVCSTTWTNVTFFSKAPARTVLNPPLNVNVLATIRVVLTCKNHLFLPSIRVLLLYRHIINDKCADKETSGGRVAVHGKHSHTFTQINFFPTLAARL